MTSFIGRRSERGEIRRLLSVSRLVTVTGFGGVGKTRLAMRVGRDVHRAFRDGVWFIDLSTLTDPALLPDTIANTLGLTMRRADHGADVLLEHLESRSALLLLDNCEHLVKPCAELIGRLLRGCPRLHCLATSREALGVLGEATFSLSPLPVGWDHVATAAPGTDYDGVALFLDRASAACPGFEVTDENREPITEICRRLDGIPLALELAAVRLRSLTPSELLEQLSEHFGLLNDGNRAGPDRQRTLRNSIDWSYQQCSEDERTLWARASVFSGMDLASMVAVVGDARENDNGALVEVLLSLVNKSIITTRSDGHHTRYQMLEIIRDYGRERLTDSGAITEYQSRHGGYFFDLADRSGSEWIGPHQAETLMRLRRENANLRSALQFGSTNQEMSERALWAAIHLTEYWITIGGYEEGRHWIEVLDAATPEKSPTLAATALRTAAWLAIAQGDRGTADKLLTRAGDVDTHPDQAARAQSDQCCALLALYRGDWEKAITTSISAVEVFAAAGMMKEQLTCIQLAQMALHWAGRSEESQVWHQRCMALTDENGESWHRSFSLWFAALVWWQAGDLPTAQQAMRESLRLKSELTDLTGVAICLEGLAWLLVTEDPRRTALLLGAAATQRELATAAQERLGKWGEAHTKVVQKARHALDDRRFDSLFEQGRSLAREEAVAIGLGSKPVGPLPASTVSSPLTKREREVAQLVAQGLSNKELADMLVISPRTAETHVENILTKLGFHSRAQIAAWVLDQ